MEFPELGTHCAVQSCSRLDFLPFECDACHGIFCLDHKTYEQHNCHKGYTKDVKVPVCPLCSQPVPVNRGEDPNIKVDEHIQKDCQSDKAKKLYTNRCSHPGCKKKELVPVKCNSCYRNFCLKHRFETDHDCQGHPNRLGGAPRNPPSSSRNLPSVASSSSGARRQQHTNRKPQTTTMSQIGAELNRERLQRQQQRLSQPHTQASGFTHTVMSEDEALALAIAASMNEAGPQSASSQRPSSSSSSQPLAPPTSSSQPPADGSSFDDDEALARAIAASLNEQQPRPKQRRPNTNPSSQQRRHTDNSDSGCHIS